jgi:hypothetical protein
MNKKIIYWIVGIIIVIMWARCDFQNSFIEKIVPCPKIN